MGEKRVDWKGNEYIEHRDQHGNITRTYTERDWKGDTYYRHTDDNGRDLGTSREVTDWTGTTHTEHYDTSGAYSGRSDTYTDYKGDRYSEHRNAKGDLTGKSTVEHDWRGAYTYNQTYAAPGSSAQTYSPSYSGQTSTGGYQPSYEGTGKKKRGSGFVTFMLILLIVVVSAVSLLTVINGSQTLFGARILVGVLLMPILFLVEVLRIRRVSVLQQFEPLRRGNLLAGAILYFVTALLFLLFAAVNLAPTEAQGFVFFLLFWLVKLVWSIVMAVRTKGFCRRHGLQSGVESASVEYLSEGFQLWIVVTETIQALGASFFATIIAKIIYLPFGVAALFGITLLLNKLTNLPYSAVIKRF
ncbi:MAG: hypothetical protein J6L88_10035 [Clostridia bacterium]|nr:hypothetical protein [Clostridia bacterium]